MEARQQIQLNIRAHDKVATRYEKVHGEIYNPTEQRRLRQKLAFAISEVRTSGGQKTALDFGCGAGNLTRHLLEAGLRVTAADVSPKFLDLILTSFAGTRQLDTFVLNGSDLSGLPDGGFDLAGSYSVLHHIPDYLAAIAEMIRVVRPGGIIYLDHEHNESYWNPSPAYRELQRLAPLPRHWSRFLRPFNYYHRLRLMLNPRFQLEGDIHIFNDDHIEWKQVERVVGERGCEIVLNENYLLCQRHYPQDVYEAFRRRCSDMRLLIARKRQTLDRIAL
jgi:ubiquinone/menaquinone biosynthesis C-methylase UbiE